MRQNRIFSFFCNLVFIIVFLYCFFMTIPLTKKPNYDFRSINLGKSDAQTERSRHPELLKEGYFDIENIAEKALNQDVFLFLGYKGSGKTALAEHLSLTKESYDCHIDCLQMRDFPYRSFASSMLPGESPEVQTSLAWRWLLLCRVFSNLLDDEVAISEREEEAHELSQLLSRLGLINVRSVADFARKSVASGIRLKLGEFFEFEKKGEALNNNSSFVDIIDLFKELISSYSTTRKLVISIDGLDDILIADEIQYIAIGTLFTEVNELNCFFSINRLPIKVIILCRTDILGRIPNTNKNKIVQDLSFSLNWYEQGLTSYKQCSLIKIGNLRCRMVYPEIKDMLKYFFPRSFNNKTIELALLEFTRHTPRDYIQLLIRIQSVCTSPKVSYSDIRKGIIDYSTKYFLGEIKDELVGYVKPELIDSVFTLLSSLHKMQFTYEEAYAQAKTIRSLMNVDLQQVFGVLFECSAIGNVYTYEEGIIRYSFKFRNPIAAFNPNEVITIHKGLWKALNLNF